MKREIHTWHSQHLDRPMNVAVYGHYGFALLMFPTAAEDFLEYERCGLLEAIRWYVEAGKVKVFSIDSINGESWLNDYVAPRDRVVRQELFNSYLTDELVPFIGQQCSRETPVITAGASLGAFQAANAFFRRPDLFDGMIAMSGSYDVKAYTDGYYDDDCYFNSPIDFLPNLTDPMILSRLREKHHIYIISGQGWCEEPERSVELARILTAKGIPHHLDLWGHDVAHDWPAWKIMLPHVLGTRF